MAEDDEVTILMQMEPSGMTERLGSGGGWSAAPGPEHPLLRFPKFEPNLITTTPRRSVLGSGGERGGRAERDERGMAVTGTRAGRGRGVWHRAPALPAFRARRPLAVPAPTHPRTPGSRPFE